MPLITVGQGTPVIPPGTYPATLIGVEPKSLVTRFSKNGEEQDFLEWTWAVEGVEITSLTSLATGPKSTMLTYLVALVGSDKAAVGAGFDEDDLVGKSVLVQIVESEDGFSKINGVIAAPKASNGTGKAKKPAPERVAAPTIEDEEEGDDDTDDLPF